MRCGRGCAAAAAAAAAARGLPRGRQAVARRSRSPTDAKLALIRFAPIEPRRGRQATARRSRSPTDAKLTLNRFAPIELNVEYNR